MSLDVSWYNWPLCFEIEAVIHVEVQKYSINRTFCYLTIIQVSSELNESGNHCFCWCQWLNSGLRLHLQLQNSDCWHPFLVPHSFVWSVVSPYRRRAPQKSLKGFHRSLQMKVSSGCICLWSTGLALATGSNTPVWCRFRWVFLLLIPDFCQLFLLQFNVQNICAKSGL